MAEDWRVRTGLELRYDGPVPAWERPAPRPPDVAAALRARMRLHRRLALDSASQVGRRAGEARARALGDYVDQRRTHTRLAGQLGRILRPPPASHPFLVTDAATDASAPGRAQRVERSFGDGHGARPAQSAEGTET